MLICMLRIHRIFVIAPVTLPSGWYFSALDNVFLAIYFVEILLKLYALRSFFFKSGWNIMGKDKQSFFKLLSYYKLNWWQLVQRRAKMTNLIASDITLHILFSKDSQNGLLGSKRQQLSIALYISPWFFYPAAWDLLIVLSVALYISSWVSYLLEIS